MARVNGSALCSANTTALSRSSRHPVRPNHHRANPRIANAAANGVQLNAGLPEAASGIYPLVLANILASPLKLLAPLLAGHVAPGGHLVLARPSADVRELRH